MKVVAEELKTVVRSTLSLYTLFENNPFGERQLQLYKSLFANNIIGITVKDRYLG